LRGRGEGGRKEKRWKRDGEEGKDSTPIGLLIANFT